MEMPNVPDLFVLTVRHTMMHRFKNKDLDIIGQFNDYMRILAGGNIHTIQRNIQIKRKRGNEYLKIKSDDGLILIVKNPILLVETLARPFEKRSGVPFNLQLGL